MAANSRFALGYDGYEAALYDDGDEPSGIYQAPPPSFRRKQEPHGASSLSTMLECPNQCEPRTTTTKRPPMVRVSSKHIVCAKHFFGECLNWSLVSITPELTTSATAGCQFDAFLRDHFLLHHEGLQVHLENAETQAWLPVRSVDTKTGKFVVEAPNGTPLSIVVQPDGKTANSFDLNKMSVGGLPVSISSVRMQRLPLVIKRLHHDGLGGSNVALPSTAAEFNPPLVFTTSTSLAPWQAITSVMLEAVTYGPTAAAAPAMKTGWGGRSRAVLQQPDFVLVPSGEGDRKTCIDDTPSFQFGAGKSTVRMQIDIVPRGTPEEQAASLQAYIQQFLADQQKALELQVTKVTEAEKEVQTWTTHLQARKNDIVELRTLISKLSQKSG
jgi:hypothetical protein